MASGERGGSDRIAAELRREILEGRRAPGTHLPAARKLAADKSVNRNTVHAAYQQLADEGLVNRVLGRGGGTAIRIERPRRELREAMRSFRKASERTEHRHVYPDVAHLLDVQPRSLQESVERVWLDEHDDVAVLESRWGEVEDGVEWRETVTARMPNPQEVEQLGLADGVPLLLMHAAGRSEVDGRLAVVELRASAARFQVQTG